MSLGLVGVIFRKELVDHLRDRRSLFSASLGIFSGPLVLGALLSQIAGDRRELETIEIPFVGRERAPALASWLEVQTGVSVLDETGAPQQAVNEGRRQLVVLVEDDFAADFAVGLPARVQILYSDERDSSRDKVQRVRRLLNAYGDRIADLRLVARGVSPVVKRPLDVEERELSQQDNRSRRLLAVAPMMILMGAFAAGMSAAADSTAGERERGSLEALLANPVSSKQIALGKWAATATLSLTGVLLGLAASLAMLYYSPLYELGVRFRLDAASVALMAAICAPVALLASAAEMLVASFAKSFKEAQSYLALAMLLPMLPLMLTAFGMVKGDWGDASPIVGQHLVLTSLLAGETPTLIQMWGSAAVTLAVTAVCVYFLLRLFRSERIVFGR